jgi:NAD(P)H-dependent FMN reductase
VFLPLPSARSHVKGAHPDRQPHQAADLQAPWLHIQELSSTVTTPLPPDLLVIAASNGENLKLAERFAEQAQAQGLHAEVLDLTALDLPLFTPRALAAGAPPDLAPLQHQLEAATRWVICAPEYNGSIPPVLTSAIAWLSVQGDDFRALFNGRPVAIATHSGGGGHAVMAALRLQLAHLGAHVVGRQLVSNAMSSAKDESIADLIHRLKQLQPLQP